VASLFVIQGRDQGRRFDIKQPSVVLGRDAASGIQLHDSEVSRRHADLIVENGQLSIVDRNSANGTYVNSRRVERHTLANGDHIQVGRTLLLYTAADDADEVELASEVDIVGQTAGGGSRIVQSLSPEAGGNLLAERGDADSPWLARARSNLQVMYRTALAVSHTLDIDQLLSRIMDLIFEWVESDRGCIMLVDQESDELIPKVRRNRQGVRTDEKIIISRTIIEYVMEKKEGVLTSDAREDDRFEAAGSIVKMGVREAICVPMQGRYGIVGLIYIDTYTAPGRFVLKRAANKFTDEHLKLMVAIGHQAALAIEDTSYYSAMVQAERLAAMGQTIATLSHHVKNILQGIRGGSYLIDEGLKASDFEVVRKGWRMVERNQEKISHLVMDMLTFSKEREPDLTPADINQVAADVVELMQTRAGEAQVELVFRPQENMPQLVFDSEALDRAILNVATNAIDACEKRPGGRVIVSTELAPAQGVVRVIVEDNGEGIPPEDQRRIFSVFESKKGSRGTGLGLPVSRKILEEHGGDIFVESAPDVGSRFTLELPAVYPETRNVDTIVGT
jgi:signal transduction histidine kinase